VTDCQRLRVGRRQEVRGRCGGGRGEGSGKGRGAGDGEAEAGAGKGGEGVGDTAGGGKIEEAHPKAEHPQDGVLHCRLARPPGPSWCWP